MRSVSAFLVIFMLTLSQYVSGQSFSFRSTKWGMDSNQVKNIESSSFLYSKGNSLYYSGKLSNLDAKIIYSFTSSDQLYQTFYVITLNSKNPSLYVNNFLILQELLSTKYNQPVKKSVNTINGKTITQDEWASNLISDNLNLETKWKTDNTEIILSLYSINDELWIEVRYTSIDFNKKVDEEKKAKLLKDI